MNHSNTSPTIYPVIQPAAFFYGIPPATGATGSGQLLGFFYCPPLPPFPCYPSSILPVYGLVYGPLPPCDPGGPSSPFLIKFSILTPPNNA